MRIYASMLSLLLLLARSGSASEASNASLPRANRATDAGYKYLIFPQGSNVQGFFTLGVTAGLAYELPSRRTLAHRKPAEVYHRRSRRELYRKLEAMLNTQGKDGRGCLLNALCRAGRRNRHAEAALQPRGPFLREILHSVFTFPDYHADGDDQERQLTRHYQRAYDAQDDCDELFNADACPWIF